MEMFHLPLEEVRTRFTTSEVVMLGWRSQEQAHKMRLKFKESPKNEAPKEKRRLAKLLNEDGIIDLRKATFNEAVGYLNSIGMKFPVPLERKPAVSRS